jgi:hypothetical protein
MYCALYMQVLVKEAITSVLHSFLYVSVSLFYGVLSPVVGGCGQSERRDEE